MMHSDRSEYGHRRQHGDRGTRQWDDYNDRWEERREPRRDAPWESYHKHGEDHGQSSSERTSRSREYSNSPKRLHSKDSFNRERSRKSPTRRPVSSPDWSISEKKRRRVTEDDKDNYRYRRESEDKMYRHSPDSFSRVPKDLKHTLPQEEDFRHRKTLQDSRNRHRNEEFTYKQQRDDLTYRRSSGYYNDRHGQERSQGHSQDRMQSQDHSMTQSYAKPRESDDSPSTDHDYRPNGTRFPLNGSSGQSFDHDVTYQSPAVPEEKKATNGFQRFLDVLNKGVNVDTLTKIVTRPPTEEEDRPWSPASFPSAVERPWSPRQQEGQQYTQNWNESEESYRAASPQRGHRSFSPQGGSDEKPPQKSDGGRSHFSSNSRSRSPSVVETHHTLTPEDEHKRRQMQDVLQAIGMDLGFEELGQMSHRIQERLYGKKDGDSMVRHRKGSRERETRPSFSPKRHSRSSPSSRSSFSPVAQDYSLQTNSYSAQRNATDIHRVQMHPAVEYTQNSSSGPFQDTEKCETNFQEGAAVFQTFSPDNTHTISEAPPPPRPIMPTYPPVNYSPLLYPAMPPNLPNVGPRFLLPHLPPFLPYPGVPPLNIHPAVLSQTRHLLPPQLASHQPPCFNLPDVNPVQTLTTAQKSKTLLRHRCLQVIETKQPG
ncbi:cyclin-dependent kinase 12-like [Scomber scombrus]|uniref:cyclin-dependent kinase 12-like n=1 Tax=Scomber scombrus TaxID=13677 RepID=UPI002DDC804A|nr:cyclin-dependent kinase 12-like [Scomber scombrus]